MIFSIEQTKNGYKEYLQHGRDGKRDENDIRIALSGDINLLDISIKNGVKQNPSQNNAYTYVFNFSDEDRDRVEYLAKSQDVSFNEILRQINQMAIRLYFPQYSDDELIGYSEIHQPIYAQKAYKTRARTLKTTTK